MATHTYTGNVKLSNGSIQKVTIEADTEGNARKLLEAQYGKANVSNVQRK